MSQTSNAQHVRTLPRKPKSGLAKVPITNLIPLVNSPQHPCNAQTCSPLRKRLVDTTGVSPITSSPYQNRPGCQGSFSNRLPNFSFTWLLVLLMSSVFCIQARASALTTNVAAGERLCFYAWVDKPNEKVGFYFAVQSGGSFDIDWTVTDPTDTIVIEGEKERQGDYIFTAALVGEYSFCFNNDMSSFSEKFVDFDIMVENEPRPVAPAKPTSISEQTSSLEDSIYKLSGSLSNIQRTQKYFRTRENRNSATVKDSRNRIFYVNVGVSLLLIGMSFTQVFVVRKFFNSPGKYVRV